MKVGETHPKRLNVWGDSLMNKLSAVTRRRRKRLASKKRRALLRSSLNRLGMALLLCTLLITGCSESATGTDKTEPKQSAEYTPQPGDVIFQSSGQSPLVQMIEGASDSHYSHCGIVDQRNGEWVVYEAKKEVSVTPMDEFISRGRDGGFAVYRFKASYLEKIPSILSNAQAYIGLPYDFRYRMDEEHIYCSELIYKAFEKATGEPLGNLVRLDELNWQPFEQLIIKLEGGPVPLERKIITPIDLALAKQLEPVYARNFEITER